MPEYRVIKKSYIHDRIYEPGEIVTWDGPKGSNLEPIGDEKRPPEPSIFTGQPGPDPGSPPPQTEGKSEFDEGGPTRATAQRVYDERRRADQEVDLPATEPQLLARMDEAEGKQMDDAQNPEVAKRAEPAQTLSDTAQAPPATTSEGPKRKKAEKPEA